MSTESAAVEQQVGPGAEDWEQGVVNGEFPASTEQLRELFNQTVAKEQQAYTRESNNVSAATLESMEAKGLTPEQINQIAYGLNQMNAELDAEAQQIAEETQEQIEAVIGGVGEKEITPTSILEDPDYLVLAGSASKSAALANANPIVGANSHRDAMIRERVEHVGALQEFAKTHHDKVQQYLSRLDVATGEEKIVLEELVRAIQLGKEKEARMAANEKAERKRKERESTRLEYNEIFKSFMNDPVDGLNARIWRGVPREESLTGHQYDEKKAIIYPQMIREFAQKHPDVWAKYQGQMGGDSFVVQAMGGQPNVPIFGSDGSTPSLQRLQNLHQRQSEQTGDTQADTSTKLERGVTQDAQFLLGFIETFVTQMDVQTQSLSIDVLNGVRNSAQIPTNLKTELLSHFDQEGGLQTSPEQVSMTVSKIKEQLQSGSPSITTATQSMEPQTLERVHPPGQTQSGFTQAMAEVPGGGAVEPAGQQPAHQEKQGPESRLSQPEQVVVQKLNEYGLEVKVDEDRSNFDFPRVILVNNQTETGQEKEPTIRIYRGINNITQVADQIPYAMRAMEEFGKVKEIPEVESLVNELANNPTYENLMKYFEAIKPHLNENQVANMERDIEKVENYLIKGYSVRQSLIYLQTCRMGGVADIGIAPYISASTDLNEAAGYGADVLVIDIPISNLEGARTAEEIQRGVEVMIKGKLDPKHITAVIPAPSKDRQYKRKPEVKANLQAAIQRVNTLTGKDGLPSQELSEQLPQRQEAQRQFDSERIAGEAEQILETRALKLVERFTRLDPRLNIDLDYERQVAAHKNVDIYTHIKQIVYDHYANHFVMLRRYDDSFDRNSVDESMLIEMNKTLKNMEDRIPLDRIPLDYPDRYSGNRETHRISKEQARQAIVNILNNFHNQTFLKSPEFAQYAQIIKNSEDIPAVLKAKLSNRRTQNSEALQILQMAMKYVVDDFTTESTLTFSNQLEVARIGVDFNSTVYDFPGQNTSHLDLAVAELRIYSEKYSPVNAKAACSLLAAMSEQGLVEPSRVQALWNKFKNPSMIGGEPWTSEIEEVIGEIESRNAFGVNVAD